MVLVYHNITPPEYFVDVNNAARPAVFPGPPRAGALSRRAATSRSATPNTTGRSSTRSDSRATGVLPVVPDFAHLSGPPNSMHAGEFDDDWVNLLFVGRVIPNKRIEDLIRCVSRLQALVQPALAAAARRLARRLRALPGHAAPASSRGSACRDVHFRRSRLERRAGRLLRDRRRLRVRERARRILRAARRSRSTWACRSSPTRPRQCPPTMDGGGVLVHRQGSDARRGAHQRRRRPIATLQDRIIDAQDAALDRLEAKDFGGTLLSFIDQVLAAPRARAPAGRVRLLGSGGRRPRSSKRSGVSPRGVRGAAATRTPRSEHGGAE